MQADKSLAELIAEADQKIKDAEDNFGQIEVRDAILVKADLYKAHAQWTEAIESYNLASKRTIQIGRKMDICFKLVSIYLETNQTDKVKEQIEECHMLLEKGGDWERKNRLKVYEGIYNIIARKFDAANKLFVEVLPTFNASEIISYETLVSYSVLTGIIKMDRSSIRKKIIESSEVLVSLMKQPSIKIYLESFYHCRTFLEMIEVVKKDRYMKFHVNYFIRETRIVVYSQFLEAYKTVKLQSMADQFGISVDFLDRQLSELIAGRWLPCKIDKFAGIIETDPSDERSKHYKAALKHGDHLFHQIQKLSRAIDV